MSTWLKPALVSFWLGVLGIQTASADGSNNQEFQTIQEVLKIPCALARVSDAYWPDPQESPKYILIQDVHRHARVQTQIAELIEEGYSHWGVKKVFMEGAFTGVDLSVFHRVPKNAQAFVLEHLVADGNLSGPELATIHIMEEEWRNPPLSPFQLFGLEDPALYRKNVLAYQSVVASRDRALEALVPIRRLQETMHLPKPNDLMEQLDRTEALLHLKLTHSDYAAYLKGRALIPSTPAIDPAVHAAENFYQFAEERSQVFLEIAAKTVPASRSPRILVVGGFHTALMAESLREAGQTFVILTPSVTTRADRSPYEKQLLETANVLAEALPPLPH